VLVDELETFADAPSSSAMAVRPAGQERLASNKRESADAAAVSHPPSPTTEPSRVAPATYEFPVVEANTAAR
jgi:hypothetical protein